MVEETPPPADEAPLEAAPAEASPARQRGRWPKWRLSPRLWRTARRVVFVLLALVAAGLVWGVTFDLGPALRVRLETAASAWLNRPVHVGRLSMYLWPGRFLIEDIVIEGLEPEHEPFFTGREVVISTSWLALLHGEGACGRRRSQGLAHGDREPARRTAEFSPLRGAARACRRGCGRTGAACRRGRGVRRVGAAHRDHRPAPAGPRRGVRLPRSRNAVEHRGTRARSDHGQAGALRRDGVVPRWNDRHSRLRADDGRHGRRLRARRRVGQPHAGRAVAGRDRGGHHG